MDFDEQDFANTLQAMAKTSKLLPEIFDLLCRAAATKVMDFDEQDFANTLPAMAKTSKLLPEIFDSLRRDAADGRLWLQPPHFAARRADEWCWPVLPGPSAPTPTSIPPTRL